MPNFSEVLHYDPETGIFRWKIRRRGIKYHQPAGAPHNMGYRQIMVDKQNYLAHRLAWFMYYGEWPLRLIDHINGNKTDNRISNLRLADHSQNAASRPLGKTNTSGIKGVSWNAAKRKWQASISVNNRTIYLGRFDEIEDAAQAYKRAALSRQGEFAWPDRRLL